MRIGKLDRLITIQRAVMSPDDMGGRRITSWDEVAKVWSEWKKPRTTISEVDGGFASVQTYEVTIRYRGDVWSGYRVLFDENTYEILHVSAVDRVSETLTLREVSYKA